MPKINFNGIVREMTSEESTAMQTEAERIEAEYWANISYAEAVNEKIRERYSLSDELALLRQMIKEPTAFAEYFQFCEECKTFVKKKKGME